MRKLSTLVVKSSAICLLLLASQFGCNRSNASSLSGNVTYDGASVSNGSISLAPLAGGKKIGTTLDQGKFRLEKLSPGKYRVEISAFQNIASPQSSAEARASSQSESASPHEIGADAIGNGVEIELTVGHQVRDFSLTSTEK